MSGRGDSDRVESVRQVDSTCRREAEPCPTRVKKWKLAMQMNLVPCKIFSTKTKKQIWVAQIHKDRIFPLFPITYFGHKKTKGRNVQKKKEKRTFYIPVMSPNARRRRRRQRLVFPRTWVTAIVAPILTAPFPLNDSPHAFLGNSNDFKNPSKSHPYEKNGLTPQIFTTKPSNQPTGK